MQQIFYGGWIFFLKVSLDLRCGKKIGFKQTLMMLHFDSDYMRGAHPAVMQRLMETNLEQTAGYGTDCHTDNAKRLIIKACGLTGGGE